MSWFDRLWVPASLAPLVGLGFLGFAVGQGIAGVEANHPHTNRISSMEFGPGIGFEERYCARIVAPSTQSQSVVLGALATALTGGGANDYHGLSGDKVFFSQAALPCAGEALDGNRIRYHVRNTWLFAPYNFQANGANFAGVFVTHNGHRDFNSYNVYLIDTSINSNAINHETGHTLGLDDATGCAVSSIMHYGCSGLTWPTQNDRNTVISNAQGN